MSKKWMKVDPATLKVGDEVRWVVEITGGRVIREVVVSEVCPRTSSRADSRSIRLGLTYIAPGNGTWYVRKPKKAKPPTRPDEPPVGSFFRVDRTGFEFWRFASMEDGYGYWQISPRSEEPDWERWDDITEPGDTITRLLLVEATDD